MSRHKHEGEAGHGKSAHHGNHAPQDHGGPHEGPHGTPPAQPQFGQPQPAQPQYGQGQYGAEQGGVAPTCARHPDQVSYVRCQRCGRPVCAQCQRPAAVGVQCADCVAQDEANAPVQRTSTGAPVRGGRPVVTYSLIGVCVVVFILQRLSPDGLVGQFAYAPFLTEVQPWRMITAGFLHSPTQLFHILANMYALWLLGQAMEPVLGRLKFFALYMVSLFGGSVGVLLLGDPMQPVVGASGAIFGLFGALFIIQRRMGLSTASLTVLIAINAVFGFVVPGIAWQAHLGGLVVGAVAVLPLAFAGKSKNRVLIQWGGYAAVVAALVIITVISGSRFANLF